MTKCIKNKVTLKSSVYNLTGQNYFEQLAAYNSMSSHLRRVLLARSVVNTRNKNYISGKNKWCKPASNEIACLHSEAVDDMIDRLVYDTQHHPMDILRMNLDPKHQDCYNCNLEHRHSRIRRNQTSYEGSHRRQRSTSRSQRTTSPTTRSPKRKKFISSSSYGKEVKNTRENSRIYPSICYSRRRKCRYETDPLFIPCTTTAVDSSEFKASRFSIQEADDHRSVSSSASRSYDGFDYDDKPIVQLTRKRVMSPKEEEKKYVKFTYDITREIMQSGLYTDKELQDVFKKHIDQNKGILNMNKMLYEIYQLKISLNIMDDDSDVDDELEDLIHAQKLLSVSEIRPPTPPKVLDENKVMEKLKSYQRMTETQRRPSSGTSKSVVLVDANPELFVTERDVLMSLIEVGIDPDQAQHVYKSLLHKSKDTAETIQIEAETSYSSNLQLGNSDQLRDNGGQTSSAVETTESDPLRPSIEDGLSEKQEANSSPSNFMSTQDVTIETEEQTDSRKASNDHEAES